MSSFGENIFIITQKIVYNCKLMWFIRRIRENRRLSEHDERLETLERKMKSLELSWEDTFDKLKHMTGRMNKRAAIIEASEAQNDEEGSEQLSTGNGAPDSLGRILTPRQLKLQHEILRRRAGM